MLTAARAKKAEGVDVVIGVAETHGRKETEALLQGLEIIPRRIVPYKGHRLAEMDIDAILSRRPALVLVDELAHTNAPESRHPKRYMDVEELLAAGIDVYTTLNIQHVESLNDVVASITKIRVRETVPDSIIDLACDIELIDLTPEDLIARLNEGKVYVPEQAERATRNYFSLAILQPCGSLRCAGPRKGSTLKWSTTCARIALKGLGPRVSGCWSWWILPRVPMQSYDMPNAWLIACAHSGLRSMSKRRPMPTRATRSAIRSPNLFASRKGSELRRFRFPERMWHRPWPTMPRPIISRISSPPNQSAGAGGIFSGSFLQMKLIRSAGDASVHIVARAKDPLAQKSTESIRSKPKQTEIKAYLASLAYVAAAVLIAILLRRALGVSNLAQVFLIAVLASAVTYGLWASLFACLISVLSYNFFFLPPLYTFTIADPENVVVLFFFTIAALIASNLAARVRAQAIAARERARITEELYLFSRKLAGVATLDDLLWTTVHQIALMLKVRVVVLLPEDGGLVVKAGFPPEDMLDEADLAAARWCFEKNQATGRGADTLPGAKRRFMPLRTGRGAVGVVGIDSDKPGLLLTPEESRLLDALSDQAALAIDRVNLAQDIDRARLAAETDRLRAALLTSISHDLRTPLASILGSASSLVTHGQEFDATVRASLMRTILEEAERLNRFIGNLLDMTRLESGPLKPQTGPADLSDIIGATLQRADKILQNHSVEIDLESGLPLLDLDMVLMEHVLFNLFDNAAKYSPQGSRIKVTARHENKSIVIRVLDEGEGIPETDLERIFDKFYRVRRSDRQRAGTGLGLAICRGFVEAMGGSITAANRIDRSGAVFTIRLPVPIMPRLPAEAIS